MSEDTRVSPKLLEQALKSSDDALIKFVLTKTPKESISSYVEPLQASIIPNFLKSFNQFIIKSPEFLEVVLPWIEQLVIIHQLTMSASSECQRRLSDLQLTLKQRTQQIGLFIEVSSLSEFVDQERAGKGIGLPIRDEAAQIITDD